MRVRDAQPKDVDAITAIYNDAVEHSTAIWNDETVDSADRAAWLEQRQSSGYPVLVAADDADEATAYATFGDWRAFDGYRRTVEHSVYVRSDRRRNGAGRMLMLELIERARRLDKHVMVAGIDAANEGSIRLHESLGFTMVGRLPEVGTKFGRWLDLAFMQLMLDERGATAESPR